MCRCVQPGTVNHAVNGPEPITQGGGGRGPPGADAVPLEVPTSACLPVNLQNRWFIIISHFGFIRWCFVLLGSFTGALWAGLEMTPESTPVSSLCFSGGCLHSAISLSTVCTIKLGLFYLYFSLTESASVVTILDGAISNWNTSRYILIIVCSSVCRHSVGGM